MNDDIELNAAIDYAIEVASDPRATKAAHYKQLAEWLQELRTLRASPTAPPPTVPDDYMDQVGTRDREKDLLTLSRAIVLDRMTTVPMVFTDYVLEGGDLLIGGVNDALETVTPRNFIAAQEWEEYVLDLVNDVRQCVLDLIDLQAYHGKEME